MISHRSVFFLNSCGFLSCQSAALRFFREIPPRSPVPPLPMPVTVNTSVTVTVNSESEPEAETPEATAKAKLTESHACMSHVITTPPEGDTDTCEWHCDDGCPFIVREFRRRSLRNCKACTPNNAIDGDAVYFTPTGKCIHKQKECQYLRCSTRISAIKCEHCFRYASHAQGLLHPLSVGAEFVGQ